MNLSAFSTILAMLAFFGVCWWVLDPKNKKRFQEDADIVLKTDITHQQDQADQHKREL